MDADFWYDLWAKDDIGFHEGRANALMVAHFDVLGLTAPARVYVPLCGKTRDIAWILAQGHRVVGSELDETAVHQLFDELGVAPAVQPAGNHMRYSAPGIDIYQGDAMALGADQLGVVDAIYDRAALIALPPDMRQIYAEHLHAVTSGAPQLVICFEYDTAESTPPPFPLYQADFEQLYGGKYVWAELQRHDVHLKAHPAQEVIRHLTLI